MSSLRGTIFSLFLIPWAQTTPLSPQGQESSSSSSLLKALKCLNYDDDTVYTNDTCKAYDERTCDIVCTENSWCHHLCGTGSDSCSDGAGAICAMMKFLNMSQTCKKVKMIADSKGVSALLPDDTIDYGALDKTEVTGTGCDDHVYCKYCQGNSDCVFIMNNVSVAFYGEKNVKKQGAGPLGMILLRHIEHVCKYFNDHFEGADSPSYLEVAGASASTEFFRGYTAFQSLAVMALAVVCSAGFFALFSRRSVAHSYVQLGDHH